MSVSEGLQPVKAPTIPTQQSTSPLRQSRVSEPLAHPTGEFDHLQGELKLLVNSKTPIITVETTEEARLLEFLHGAAGALGVPLYQWSVTTGLAKVGGAPIYGSEPPEQALANIAAITGDAIFVLKDFARYCDNDRISRRLRDMAETFRAARRSIVITAASMTLPAEIASESAPFAFGLPTAEQLLPSVRQVLSEANRNVPGMIPLGAAADRPAIAASGEIAHNLVGLTEEAAIRTLRRCVLASGQANAQGPSLASLVLDAKREALHSEGILEPVRRDASFANVAGLHRLRAWAEKRRNALTPEGRKFGLEPPKGILITGVQGCGKSLAARALAGEWGVELARLDAGALYDKYIGETEKQLHRTLEIAQKLAPMVLWIDEIEKAFASASASGDADAGLSQRLLATLLTWMQDREGGVFLAATSNNIMALPPEMLRKGRFDEIFFVDLPNAAARTELFVLHLKKRERDPAGFDLPKLAAATEGFSGAEIEQAIVSSLYTAFDGKKELTTDILLAEVQCTKPLSVTRAEDVAAIRDWAKSRAAPAD